MGGRDGDMDEGDEGGEDLRGGRVMNGMCASTAAYWAGESAAEGEDARARSSDRV